MQTTRPPVLQTGASSIAGSVDLLFWGLNLVAIFFSVAIALAIVYFVVRYRRGSVVDRSRPPQYHTAIEIAWTVIPLGIALGLFSWAAMVYFQMHRVPPNAMEVNVVGKQWMWKLQQPSGKWEMNELHIPVGRPVKLNMTSEDVIHSFYIPDFRLKQDVLPGRFTQLWFTATRPGVYRLYCAEFCGTLHSTMIGYVYAMEPAEYDRWLAAGETRLTVAAEGEQLFRKFGCSGCHGPASSVRAPALEGIFGKPVAVQIRKPGVPLEQTPATTIIADTRYIHDSIVLPEQEIAAGYRPIMPSFKNRLSEEEILKLVAYIRSLATASPPPGERRRADYSGQLGPEEYRARTGFVPQPLPSGAAAGAGRQPGARSNPPAVTGPQEQ